MPRVRNAAAQTLAAPAPTVAARHVGRRRRLIDEHQFQRIEVELTSNHRRRRSRTSGRSCSLACADFF